LGDLDKRREWYDDMFYIGVNAMVVLAQSANSTAEALERYEACEFLQGQIRRLVIIRGLVTISDGNDHIAKKNKTA
jgi:hypothetical protein